jgi:hypothetical protein
MPATSGQAQQPERSLEDAIARAQAAARAYDHARAMREQHERQRIFFNDVHIPSHLDAKRVQIWSLVALLAGILMLVILPDNFVLRSLGFAGMFALLFIGVPNLVLKTSGALSRTKLIAWVCVLLFTGMMTTTALGESLWSWAPWFSQFTNPGHSTVQPHK